MATFDELVSDIIDAQDTVTHLVEMGAVFESDTRKAQETRTQAIERLRERWDAMEKACSELIAWVDDAVWPCPLCGGLTIHHPDCPYIQAVSAITKTKGE